MTLRIVGPDDPALNVLEQALAQRPQLALQLEIFPWASYREEMLRSLRAPTAEYHAVFVPGHVWLPELVAAGYLAPLSPLFESASAEARAAYDAADILPEVAAESAFDGQPYLLPYFSDGHILFYRDDLFELGEGAVPVVSTSALAELAAQVHNPPALYGIALKADASEILTDWLPYLWEAGGRFFDGEGRPDFANAANVDSLERYCALRRYCPAHTHHFGNAEIAGVLRQGEAALVATWGGQAAPIFLDPGNAKDHRYRAAVFPVPWNATWGIGVAANVAEATQHRLMESLLPVAGPEQDRQIISAAGSPVRASSYQNGPAAAWWLPAQREMLRRARPLPARPELGAYLGLLYSAVHRAFTGEQTAAAALTEVQAQAVSDDDPS